MNTPDETEGFDDYEDNDCWNCGGEGFVAHCWTEYACMHPDEGCDLCMRRCEFCAAQAMSAGTAETLEAAQGDSPPARSEGCAHTSSPTLLVTQGRAIMSEQHTPGPWEVSVEPGDEWWFGNGSQAVIRPANGKSYDSVAVLGGDSPTELADARLIAAAPELLEALETFVREYVELVDSGDAGFWDAESEEKVIAARAAIAKAKGTA